MNTVAAARVFPIDEDRSCRLPVLRVIPVALLYRLFTVARIHSHAACGVEGCGIQGCIPGGLHTCFAFHVSQPERVRSVMEKFVWFVRRGFIGKRGAS